MPRGLSAGPRRPTRCGRAGSHVTGPLVLDCALGRIVGIVMDYWQRPQFDFGPTGPEKGIAAGKALILGPGQDIPLEAVGYHVVHMPTRFAFIGNRMLTRTEKDELAPLTKPYPFGERNAPNPATVISATKDYLQSQPRGFRTGRPSTRSCSARRSKTAIVSSMRCCAISASRKGDRLLQAQNSGTSSKTLPCSANISYG